MTLDLSPMLTSKKKDKFTPVFFPLYLYYTLRTIESSVSYRSTRSEVPQLIGCLSQLLYKLESVTRDGWTLKTAQEGQKAMST